MSILSGKSVVNIGGTGGLGFEFSKQLLLTGVEVIIIYDKIIKWILKLNIFSRK